MRKLTTEEFIAKAKSVHGDKYVYDKSVYIRSKIKIIITCNYHGDFEQTPDAHLNGAGCQSCSGGKRKTTREFVTDAIAKHGDSYDYSKVEYINSHTKITITCATHGDFEQLPYKHLEGLGCRLCGYKRISEKKTHSIDSFISRAVARHGLRYDYSAANFNGMDADVNIKCNIHGLFTQRAISHVNGKGCPSCGIQSRVEGRTLKVGEFIIRSNKIHDSRYDYHLVDYRNVMSKVKIACPIHGIFMQSPNTHMKGSGCPSCAKGGYNPSLTGYVYFLMADGIIKVGITNKIRKRLSQLKSGTPFDFNLIHKIKTTGAEAMRIEKYYHKKYESAGLTGFDGATEWLKYSPELMSEIMNKAP